MTELNETGLDLSSLYPMLGQLSPALASRLQAVIQPMTVPVGTVLFDERQPCQGFPLVLRGSIRVVKPSANGRELPLYRVLPGESCIISSSCLLGGTDYNARGAAEAETTLGLIPRPLFDELMGEPVFRDFMFKLFSERIAALMELVEEVAFRKLDQRLAGRLLGHGRLLHTTHQQLADELGSVREMITRLLKGFADQGLVRLAREQVEIVDPVGLRQIAGG